MSVYQSATGPAHTPVMTKDSATSSKIYRNGTAAVASLLIFLLSRGSCKIVVAR